MELVNIPTEDIPKHEAWLFKNGVAREMVFEGLAQAAVGRFAKKPPNLDDVPPSLQGW